jgi:hemerythrin superfamily protein
MLKTKKPLKRNVYIKTFSRDHHLTLLFCWKIRQGLKMNIAGERMRKYVAYFWQQHLQSHLKEEEKILYALIKDRQVEKAMNDHKLIREHIQPIIDDSGFTSGKALAKLADMVDEHVRYEERILFHHLEIKLTREQLEKIGQKVQNLPAPLADEFGDQFWNN